MARLSRAEAALNARVREWASSRRLPCPDRGPIPVLVREAYQQAHGSLELPASTPGRAIAPATAPVISSTRRRTTMPASAAGGDLNGDDLVRLAAAPEPSTGASQQELRALRADFPQYDITRDTTLIPARYVSRRISPGVHPHTVVTQDPGELRAILSQ